MDEQDPIDGKTYIYVTFTMNSASDIHILRIQDPSSPKIDWHMKLAASVGTKTNIARHIFMDPSDTSQFYWLGQYDSVGSVIKF
jgi:hypothetical protein